MRINVLTIYSLIFEHLASEPQFCAAYAQCHFSTIFDALALAIRYQFCKATVLLQILGLYPCCLIQGLTRLYGLQTNLVQFLFLGNCVPSESTGYRYRFSSVRHMYALDHGVRDVTGHFKQPSRALYISSLHLGRTVLQSLNQTSSRQNSSFRISIYLSQGYISFRNSPNVLTGTYCSPYSLSHFLFFGKALTWTRWRAGVNERFGVSDTIKGLSHQMNLASFVEMTFKILVYFWALMRSKCADFYHLIS